MLKMATFVLALSAGLFVSSLSVASNGDPGGNGKTITHTTLRSASAHAHRPHAHPHLDHSGRKRTGQASYYGKRFDHKKTASGEVLDQGKMTAASKTLPLGTRAKITNTENGKSAEVTINDRGPYKKSRILDVTAKAADKLGLKPDGVSSVEVQPLAVPQTDRQIEHPNH